MNGFLRSRKKYRFLFLITALSAALVTLGPVTAVAAGELLVLPPPLVRSLNSVLKAGAGLHKSLVNQDEEQTEMGIRDMIFEIDQARATSRLSKPHERAHLTRILDAAKEQFELTQTAFGDERRTRLEDAYNQLVNLVRIYRLDRSYTIFFCAKDRTTWVQRGMKPQNPFRPEREPCGIPVPYK
jgi:hypothetical protein